jgi:hypothetical protein
MDAQWSCFLNIKIVQWWSFFNIKWNFIILCKMSTCSTKPKFGSIGWSMINQLKTKDQWSWQSTTKCCLVSKQHNYYGGYIDHTY